MSYKIIVYIIMFSTLLSCGDDERDISLNFKLEFDNEPLVMLDEYTFPSGELIKFTRFSFYISDLTVTSGMISSEVRDVDLINLTSSHSSLAAAKEGLSYQIKDVPDDPESSISLLLGVAADLNKNVPSDFTGDHPLANSGEYWIAWDSYIFFKIEGIVDLDGDGETETNVALHIGSDEASRTAKIAVGDQDNIDINIDVNAIFQDGDDIFNIHENPQIHSLNQIDQANFLMDNFSKQLNLWRSIF